MAALYKPVVLFFLVCIFKVVKDKISEPRDLGFEAEKFWIEVLTVDNAGIFIWLNLVLSSESFTQKR